MQARDNQGSSRSVALISLIAGLLLASCGLAFTIFSLEIQSAARAYVSGNGLWSKAQFQATYHLSRYSHNGADSDLRRARQALNVPLGDRRARLALDREPPDLEAARQGLIEGGNHPDDIDRLIWMYRYFSDYLFFREAVELWRESDDYILRLAQLADEMEAEFRREQPDREELAGLREDLVNINRELLPLDMAFAETLAAGTRWLNNFLIAASIFVLLLVVAGAITIFLWATRKVAASENKFRATFQHAAVGMAQLYPDEYFAMVNDSLCDTLGYTREEILQNNLPNLTHDPDRGIDAEKFRALMKGDIESYITEKRLLCKNGEPIWCKLTLSRIGNYLNRPEYLIAVIEDVSEARRLSTELNYQATHDSLTGLFNRVEFEHRLNQAIHESVLMGRHNTLCLIDLDQFKIVNDTCGHVAGDALLCEVVKLLSKRLRRGDVLARLGGDEFGIIFAECDIEAARDVGEKLRMALTEFSFIWEGATFNITASLGLVEIDDSIRDTGALLKIADTACYAAKDSGRNQIHVYSESDMQLVARRAEMEWVHRIREAILDQRLLLNGQCIQSLQNAGHWRYEILVRFVDKDGAIIMPADFLPAAERYNVVMLIDRWVVQATLDLMERHPGAIAGMEAVHINVSGQSVSRTEFLEYVENLLDSRAIPAGKICFEITETAVMSSLVDARHFMESLKQRGCHFALDDFGSGLSSFGYLRSLPVDVVKIDGTFVHNMDQDKIHMAMVRSIAEIGHIMKKITIAEFVESDTIRERLASMGVDYGQGYAIHKPEPFEGILQRLEQERTDQGSVGRSS